MGASWHLWIQSPQSNRPWELRGLPGVSMVTTVTVMLSQSAVGEEDEMSYNVLVSVSFMSSLSVLVLLL